MTTQDLHDAGYHTYPLPSVPMPGCYATTRFQKAIKDRGVTLYFINVDYYEAKYDTASWTTLSGGFEADITLYGGDVSCPWLTVQVHNIGRQSVAWLEGFAALAYKRLECVPDIHNN